MKYIPIILLVVLLFACSNGKGGKNNESYDGGHGIGIDTATIHQIDLMEDSVLVTKEDVPDKTTPKTEASSSYRHIAPSAPSHDNMRGFDPASEDDMDDNGMSRYMDNNDEEGWD